MPKVTNTDNFFEFDHSWPIFQNLNDLQSVWILKRGVGGGGMYPPLHPASKSTLIEGQLNFEKEVKNGQIKKISAFVTFGMIS